MTYAELYGNIKKRPLKRGLLNKLIATSVDASNRLSSIVGTLENISTAGMGDAIEDMITTTNNFKSIADEFKVNASVFNPNDHLQGIN